MKPISKTAYYTAALRAQDAGSSRPVCNDQYAKLFVNDTALEVFDRFKSLTGPNISTLYRHKIIDDHLSEILKDYPDTRIFIIGAGFDTRPYRLAGGIWTELDQPELFEYKDERLPVSQCKNPLVRIPIDFAAESLKKKLMPFKTAERVAVVVEGVFYYLNKEGMENIIQSVTSAFPRNFLFCELMSSGFFHKYSMPVNEVVKTMGAEFQYIVDEQIDLFYNAGYKVKKKTSILKKAFKGGHLTLFPKLLFPFFRTAINGLSVFEFEFGAASTTKKK